jgi:hypothetical protein
VIAWPRRIMVATTSPDATATYMTAGRTQNVADRRVLSVGRPEPTVRITAAGDEFAEAA